jgi:hypothetical protein
MQGFKVVGRGHLVKVAAHRVAGRSLVTSATVLGQARVHRQHAIGQRIRRVSDLESSSSLPCWLRPRQRSLQASASRQAPREHCARLPTLTRQTREDRHLNGAAIADGRGRARTLELTGIRPSELESSSSLPCWLRPRQRPLQAPASRQTDRRSKEGAADVKAPDPGEVTPTVQQLDRTGSADGEVQTWRAVPRCLVGFAQGSGHCRSRRLARWTGGAPGDPEAPDPERSPRCSNLNRAGLADGRCRTRTLKLTKPSVAALPRDFAA